MREANDYAARCDLAPAADPLLRSLVMHGAHAALSSARKDGGGGFAGLAAGLAYSNPPRTYYRDGYWTLQLLARLAPDIAAAEIELLAGCVQAERRGAERGDRRRAGMRRTSSANGSRTPPWPPRTVAPANGGATTSTARCSSCWPSPSTRRRAATTRSPGASGRSWQASSIATWRLRGPAGLPVKPRNDRDWADNVYRDGLVAYDIGLWIGALDALAALGERLDPQLGAAARAEAAAARAAADAALWRGDRYADYVRPDGWAEAHPALDALMLLRFGAVPAARALAVLDEVRSHLESRHNSEQPYGDFGVLCAFPPFADRAALRAKSADPYRYHNGGEWPWLDAVYAAERLRRGLPGWRYPLTRWWSYCLEQGWAGPVEHFSVPYGRGSLLQGWSSLPAAVALEFADRVLAGDPEVA